MYSCGVGPRRVFSRHQGVLAEGYDDRLLLDAQRHRMGILWFRWQIFDRCALFTLGGGRLVDALAQSQNP
jgi:hypothetical protein